MTHEPDSDFGFVRPIQRNLPKYMQGAALFEGSAPVLSVAAVARQGYAALKAGRPQIVTGLINRITAVSTRFIPTALLLPMAGRLNRSRSDGGNN
jgi:short-subunit dehydrogenase